MIPVVGLRISGHSVQVDKSVRDSLAQAVTATIRNVVKQRNCWLNPEGADEAELKKRTLTNLCNQRPTWLDFAHKKLDETVLDAYNWPHDLTNDEILERLLILNLNRASVQERE